MNTITATDENSLNTVNSPGAELARLREKKGFTKEFVAGKLHLRVKLIELLEEDDYPQMPEPVFIKGYLRAYAKLLGVHPDSYIDAFNSLYTSDKKPEKALWQSKKESNRSELIVRLLTAMIAISAIVAVSFWWQKNKDEQPFSVQAAKEQVHENVVSDAEDKMVSTDAAESEAKLTPLSKMQSMFTTKTLEMPTEKTGG